jgi:hypothetical protein
MRSFRVLILIFVCLAVSLQSALAQAEPDLPEAPDAWTPVAPGVDFQIFNLTSPRKIQIFVTRADPSNPNVTIDTGIGTGRIAAGRETVLNMALRYDQAINYWGQQWGNRNQVVAAVNGYYFDGATGEPWEAVIHSSWHAHRYTPTIGDAGFTWTLDRQAFIGKCVYYVSEKNDVTFPDGYNPNLSGVNILRTDESFLLYTPQYDSDTNTVALNTDPVLEIVVQLERPALLISDPAFVRGYVREIRNNEGSTPIPFDSVVLAFWGDVRSSVLSRVNSGAIQAGSEVHLTQEVADCPLEPVKRPWVKAYAALGGDGDYHFLTDGVKKFDFSNTDAYVANSRTAVVFKRTDTVVEYIYFIVVDGFNTDSIGIKIPELRDWVVQEFGATDGVALDSGGSSTMVVNNAVVNNTTCNFTRDCGILAADGSAPSEALLPLDETYGVSWTDETGLVEPLVGTSLMMIVSQPISVSHTFSFTQEVLVTSLTPVRLGPGSNYAAVATAGAGLAGVIVDHFSALDGVLAKGDHWWYVDFNDYSGWVREPDLLNLSPVRLGNDVFLPIIGQGVVQTQAALNARLALRGEWPLSDGVISPDIPADLPQESGDYTDPISDPRRFPSYPQQ